MNLTIETTTMKHSILRRLAGVMAGCLLVLAGQAGATPRDDTEIYFNRAADSSSRPNVLFILDDSTSMRFAVSEKDATSRIAALKASMRQALESTDDINIGLMNFNNNRGGSVLFPVTDIDADVTTVPGEAAEYIAVLNKGENDARENEASKAVSLGETLIEDLFVEEKTPREIITATRVYRVDAGSEDASQVKQSATTNKGKMDVGGSSLNLTHAGANESIFGGGNSGSDIGVLFDSREGTASNPTIASADDAEQRSSGGRVDVNDLELDFDNWIGLRFPAVTVPRGATIESAYLEFYAVRNDTSRRDREAAYTIRGEDSADATAYVAGRRRGLTTGRSYLSTTVRWIPGAWSTGQRYRSADIKDIVQQQVRKTGWASGNALAFRIDRGQRRRAAAVDRGAAQAPRLVVSYTPPRISPNAFIEEAHLEFEIDDTSKTAVTSAQVYGLLTDLRSDADSRIFRELLVEDFNDTDYDLSFRGIPQDTPIPYAKGVAWPSADMPSVKKSGYDVKSPDIKDAVQAIVSQGCETRATAATFSDAGCVWAGDKLGFRVAATSGARVFESQDKGGDSPPRLTVKYKQLAKEGKQALIGLRFEDINIPRGATVTSASLVFIPAADEKRPMKWNIQAEKAGDSAAFTATNRNLSARTKTTASAAWTLSDWKEGEAAQSVDLTAVVKEVTGQAGWCGGNALSFLISRDSDKTSEARKRKFVAYEGFANRAVRFKYSYNHTDGKGTCNKATLRGKTVVSTDDAEETQGGASDGAVGLDGNALRLGDGRVIGVRFPGVALPRNATILEARLEFYASQDSGAGNATFEIQGEDAGDAAPYTNGSKNISTRSYAAPETSWTTGQWQKDERYRSADIKAIVEQQVKNTDWNSGGALAFKLESDSGGDRSAVSQDGASQLAPRLFIAWDRGVGNKARFKTTRARIEEIVDDINPLSASTPIQETLIEAANYWRGGAVNYGLNRGESEEIRNRISGNNASNQLFGTAFRLYRHADYRTRESSALSHPGSYCKSETDCGNADTGADGARKYGVLNPADNPNACDPAKNPYTENCRNQQIKVKAGLALSYQSPFSDALQCQANFQVLLTDGAASAGTEDVQGKAAQTAIKAIIGADKTCRANKPDGSANNEHELCSPELAEFLAEQDQSATLNDDQTVTTHTIGFSLGSSSAEVSARNHLQQIAGLGGGRYFSANSADSLAEVFAEILSTAKSAPASFAAAPVAANAFNRLFSRDNIYFGSFAPAPGKENYENRRWAGNLKKYRICVDSAGPDGDPNTTEDNCTLGQILDASRKNAIDGKGLFEATARSLWTDGNDGNDTKKGGAGAEIDNYQTRVLYTDINNSGTANTATVLSGAGFKITDDKLTTDNTLRTVWDAVCKTTHAATATSPDAACKLDLEWMLGRDVDDEDNDSSTTDTRFVFSDVLHSSPAAVTYDRDSSGSFIDRILIGTNAGGLHFIDGDNGKEQWAFMPNALLKNQQALRTNPVLRTGERHGYGLDATPVLRIEDTDNDGKIETADGDKVHVYMAMRRGGNSIYALDISNRAAAPKFLWRIDGENNSSASGGIARGDFSRMGQTFSEPVLARINTSDGRKTVLIFGGGYDTSLDNDKPAKTDGTKQPGRNFGLEAGKPNQGNAIYVVDADSGALIFWIGHASDTGQGINASGADIEVPKMFYSIASNVNVFDSDGDGADDRLYVGDTAGNVWRVDLGADINPAASATSPEGSTVVGHFASLSTEGTLADERRIFYRPAVVQVRDTRFSNAERGEYDYVVVATGNRANPLATGTDDRLYALRDAQTGPMAGSNGLATGYPKTLPATAGGAGGASTAPLDNSDLVKINPDLTTGLTGTIAEKSAEGWYLDLKTAGGRTGTSAASGEKALAPPLVLSGNILFSTYLPVDPSDPCAVSVGNGRAYNLGILSGRAGLNWDGSDPSEAKTTADAVFQLKSGGIPPQVVPVYTTEGIKYLVGKESPPGITQNAAVKTYWYLERE